MPAPNEDPDLRDSIGSAFDDLSKDDGNTLDDPSLVQPAANEPKEQPLDEPTDPPKGATRDALGRFVSDPAKPEKDPNLDPNAPQPTKDPVQQVQQPVPEDRAPQSWSPAAREEWRNIGPVARAEILKRDREVQSALNESHTAREIATNLQQVCMPHMARIQANGVNPLQAIANLFDTEAALSTGSSLQRAQTIARLVQVYGVDIKELDNALAGVAPSPDNAVQATVQDMLRRELAPFHQMMASANQRRQEMSGRAMTSAQTDLERFSADPKNEFYEDVRDVMADIIEVAGKRGFDVSLQDAYAQAVQMTPSVREVLASRSQRTGALSANAAAQKARRAAVSISGAPVIANSVEQPEDLRSQIAASIDSLST